MMRPQLSIAPSSPRYVPSPLVVKAATPEWEARQRRATLLWVGFAGACFAVAVGMAVAWGLS